MATDLEIEVRRKEISRKREGGFVGYNDGELEDLIPHVWDEPHGASGVVDGFLFGGEIFPSAAAAVRVLLPPIKPSRTN